MQTPYTNPAVQQAFQKLRQLSADEETRRRAEIRERALKDERSFLWEAREEGLEEGMKKGLEKGLEKGLKTGELIGSIRTLQRMLREPASEDAELRQHDPETLQQMLQELETRLNDSLPTS